MVAAVNRLMKLIRVLNEKPDLSLNLADAVAAADLSYDELRFAVDELNQLEPLIGIDGVPGNRTICLRRRLDLLNEEELFRSLSFGGRVQVIPVIDSTNLELMRHQDNLVNLDVLLAELQTAGRGRRGSRWVSSFGASLTFSMVLEFEQLNRLQGLSLVAGLAICESLEKLGFNGIKLKWPNDVFLNGAKICGILIETVSTVRGIFAIIGIGINVHADPCVSAQVLRRNVACLDGHGINVSRNSLACMVIENLKHSFHRFKAEGLHGFIGGYERFSLLQGRLVTVEVPGSGIVSGVAAGISSNGELLLAQDGKEIVLAGGHISSIS